LLRRDRQQIAARASHPILIGVALETAAACLVSLLTHPYAEAVFFRVRHESLYRYDVPVQLGSHTLRLTPRAGAIQIRSRQLLVDPQPSAWAETLDAFGNPITILDFSGSTQTLRIESRFELDTLALPELWPLGERLPLALTAHGELGPYLIASPHPAVRAFADQLAADVQREPVSFLDHLTRTLYARIDRHIRPSGNAREAHETLALGSGACRDLTVLFLDVCCSQGLAGRFVSGYQAQAQTPDGQRHLHAWAEVFLPGAGWRAWDPTHGVRVTDGHVALCAAPQQSATMPVEGGFFFQGPAVNSTLDHSVRIATQ
jgi:transglutaminase-like putative cysteine protease